MCPTLVGSGYWQRINNAEELAEKDLHPLPRPCKSRVERFAELLTPSVVYYTIILFSRKHFRRCFVLENLNNGKSTARCVRDVYVMKASGDLSAKLYFN